MSAGDGVPISTWADDSRDDLLRLIFTAVILCSPPKGASPQRFACWRLTTENCRAFSSRADVAQRIVRQAYPGEKRVRSDPRGAELAALCRLEVIYLVFNEVTPQLRVTLDATSAREDASVSGYPGRARSAGAEVTPCRLMNPGSRSGARMAHRRAILLLDQKRALGSTPHPSWSAALERVEKLSPALAGMGCRPRSALSRASRAPEGTDWAASRPLRRRSPTSRLLIVD